MFVSRNVFGHYEGVDRALFRALFSGSTKVLPGPLSVIECFLNSGVGGTTPRRFLRSIPEISSLAIRGWRSNGSDGIKIHCFLFRP